MIQNNDLLVQSFDKLADNYDIETNTMAHYIDDFVVEKHLEEFLKNHTLNKTLDAGGGTGKWSIYLSKKGINTTYWISIRIVLI
jgi:ubiquinone/menaquinone biosynthesis C-methylase UbiE